METPTSKESPEMKWFFRWIMPILLPFSILAWVILGQAYCPELMEKLFGP